MGMFIVGGHLFLSKSDINIRWITYQGRHIPIKETENRIAERKSVIQRTLKRVENDIRFEGKEHGIVVNKNGKEIWHQIGESGFIDVQDAVEKGLLQRNHFTHNHPSNRSFSSDDILMMFKFRLPQVRAISPKFLYTLTPPKNFNYSPKQLRLIVRKIYAIENEMYKKAEEDYWSMIAGAKVDQKDYNHLFARKLANITGMKYTRRVLNDEY